MKDLVVHFINVRLHKSLIVNHPTALKVPCYNLSNLYFLAQTLVEQHHMIKYIYIYI